MDFEIEFSVPARDHLNRFRKRDQQVILDAIDVQLTNEPDRPTRNRKLLEDNPLAPWELRVGDFRIFYDVSVEAVTRGDRGGRAQGSQQVVHRRLEL